MNFGLLVIFMKRLDKLYAKKKNLLFFSPEFHIPLRKRLSMEFLFPSIFSNRN